MAEAAIRSERCRARSRGSSSIQQYVVGRGDPREERTYLCTPKRIDRGRKYAVAWMRGYCEGDQIVEQRVAEKGSATSGASRVLSLAD